MMNADLERYSGQATPPRMCGHHHRQFSMLICLIAVLLFHTLHDFTLNSYKHLLSTIRPSERVAKFDFKKPSF